VCLGRHIAELEVKMVIPTLLLAFDVSCCLILPSFLFELVAVVVLNLLSSNCMTQT